MFQGLVKLFGTMTGVLTSAGKIALGQNPCSPLNLRAFRNTMAAQQSSAMVQSAQLSNRPPPISDQSQRPISK